MIRLVLCTKTKMFGWKHIWVHPIILHILIEGWYDNRRNRLHRAPWSDQAQCLSLSAALRWISQVCVYVCKQRGVSRHSRQVMLPEQRHFINPLVRNLQTDVQLFLFFIKNVKNVPGKNSLAKQHCKNDLRRDYNGEHSCKLYDLCICF